MSKWSEYYKERVNNKGYEKAFAYKYHIFLNYIATILDSSFDKDCSKHKIHIKEEGCGIGTVSKLVGAHYAPYLFTFSDIDQEMIRLCDKNNAVPTDDTSYCKFLIEDILSSDKKYISNSYVVTHGVLEHFPQEEVEEIIYNYNANPLIFGHIHYVPTDKYLKPSFGDERLLPVEEWVDLIKPTRYIVDNSGKDLYLITEK